MKSDDIPCLLRFPHYAWDTPTEPDTDLDEVCGFFPGGDAALGSPLNFDGPGMEGLVQRFNHDFSLFNIVKSIGISVG